MREPTARETTRICFFPSGSANRTKKNRKTKNKKTHHDVIGRRDRQPQRLLPEEKPAVERVERDRRGLVAASLQGRVRRVRRGGSRSRAGLLSAVGGAVKVCGRSQRRDLRRPPLVLGDRCLCSAELQPPYRRRRLGGGYGVHSRKRKGKKAQAQRFFFFSATSQEERERERERESPGGGGGGRPKAKSAKSESQERVFLSSLTLSFFKSIQRFSAGPRLFSPGFFFVLCFPVQVRVKAFQRAGGMRTRERESERERRVQSARARKRERKRREAESDDR